jgi:hypothetical protein
VKVLFERVVIKEYLFGIIENLTGDLSKGFSEGVQRRGSAKEFSEGVQRRGSAKGFSEGVQRRGSAKGVLMFSSFYIMYMFYKGLYIILMQK